MAWAVAGTFPEYPWSGDGGLEVPATSAALANGDLRGWLLTAQQVTGTLHKLWFAVERTTRT